MTSAPSHPPLQPTVLVQRYRLDRRLAQGGMAEVWVGFDLHLSRPIAVKVLKASLATDPVVTERFRREAIAVAQLSHPNIVTVYDAIEEDGRQAVVMQLVNGKSLRQLLDEQKKLSPDLTIHIGSCVASALDAAHRAGLVHRDVKPGNILITPDGRVLLTDFGIAKELEPNGEDLTNENIMMGTAKYLSPEQVRGKRLDGRADLYALGLVLYECLAGRVPFLGQNDMETALARLQRDPTDITSLRPTLPYGLPELIHRLLARRPTDRYDSGAALKSALNDVATRQHDPTFTSQFERPRTDRTPTNQQRGPSGTPTGTPGVVGPLVGSPVHATGRGGDTPRGTLAGGVRPTHAPGRPAGVPVVRSDRERTPAGQSRVQPRPARQYEQRRSPSLLVVGGLLSLAVVVSAVLWSTLGSDDGNDEPFELTSTSPAAVTSAPVTTLGQLGDASATIAAIGAFDPDGDATENDDLTPLVVDGDPSTAWSTVCYSSKYLGGKAGVGLVIGLTGAARGTLVVQLANGPWNLDVFASDAEVAPSTVAAWGARIASDSGTEAATLTFPVTTPARHYLVLFHEVGPGATCSTDNPYQGGIAEIRFEATA